MCNKETEIITVPPKGSQMQPSFKEIVKGLTLLRDNLKEILYDPIGEAFLAEDAYAEQFGLNGFMPIGDIDRENFTDDGKPIIDAKFKPETK